MTTSPDQDAAITAAVHWYRHRATNAPFRLEGAAGTGKSTTVTALIEALGKPRTAYVAPTGKAASVLRAKGCTGASTIHSAIYRPAGERTAQIRTLETGLATFRPGTDEHTNLLAEIERVRQQPVWALREPDKAFGGTKPKLVVLDEASMVDDRMFAHLASFEIPILALGDPHQLPPVGGTARWMSGSPDALLTTIHRGGDRDSLIRLATDLRNGRLAPAWDGTAGATRRPWRPDQLDAYDQIVVGRRTTRWRIIEEVRAARSLPDGVPVPGDRVMVTRNDAEHDVVNGMQGVVEHAQPINDLGAVALTVVVDGGGRVSWMCDPRGFAGQRGQDDAKRDRDSGLVAATFAHAVTCHSAQGSQWPRVAVVDESAAFRGDAKAWRYTASTRAEKACLLLDPARMLRSQRTAVAA